MSTFWEELFPGIDKPSDVKEAIKLIEDFQKAYSDLIKQTNDLKTKYTKNINEVVKTTEELDKAIDNLSPASAKGREQINKMSKAADEAAKEYDDLNKNIVTLEGTIGQLTKEQEEYNKSAEKTLKTNKDLEKAQKRLAKLNSDEAAEIAKVNVQIRERRKELKEQAEETLNVVKTQSLFSKNQDRIAEALENTGGAAGNAVGGVKAFGAQLKALLANPIVLILAAIVGTLALLTKAWQKSAAGAQFFAKAGAFVEGIMSSLVGIADSLVKSLVKVFDDPIGSLQEFGTFLLNNIINRFKAIIDIVGIAGKAIGQLIDRDLDGLKESALEAGQALIQMQTGLDPDQQKKIAEGFAEIANQVNETASAFIQLEEAQRAVRKENRILQKEVENLITQEEVLLSIRDDATKSFAEREAASQLAAQAIEERAQREQKIAKNNLDLINAELRIRKANGEAVEDLLDSQLNAYTAFVASEREYTLAVRENEKERDQLRQDRLERDLDILIDGFDNQKTVNERVIADDRRVLAERRKVFDETRKLSENSFAQQIATIQLFTDEYVNANDLLATSDATVLNEKIRQLGLSEIIEGRLLEIIRERRIVTQDLADIERELTEEENNRLQATTQADLDRIAARKAIAVETRDFSIRAVNERVDAEIAAEEARTQALLDQEGLLAQEREQIAKDSEDKITEIRENGARDRTEIIEQEIGRVFELGEAVIGFFSALNERRNLEDQERLERIEEQRERDLAGAENNAALQEAINEQADRKKKEIERRQAIRARKLAIAEKAATVTGIILNTALAISKVLGQSGLFGLPLVPIVAGIGAIQLATALAQPLPPIPQFAEGTSNAPGGLAIVGEEGREMVITPSGKVGLTGGKAHLMDVPQGSTILTNAITENILKQTSENNESDSDSIKSAIIQGKTSVIANEMRKHHRQEGQALLEGLKRVFDNKPIQEIKFRHGQLVSDLVKGSTTIRNWKDKNSD